MEIKNCPFCGHDKTTIKPSVVIVGGVYVACTNCENTSASALTAKDAIEDWNDYA